MKLEGTYTFTAPAAQVWAALQNPAALAQALPDCQRVQCVGPHRYVGTLRVHAGLIQSQFHGMVQLSDVAPQTGFALHAEAHSTEGSLSGDGRLWLEPDDRLTHLHYRGQITVSGQLLEIGHAYLETTARAILRQSLTNMDQLIRGELPAVGGAKTAPTAGAVPAGAAPTHATLRKAAPPALAALLLSGAASLGGWLLARSLYARWLRHLTAEVARRLAAEPHA